MTKFQVDWIIGAASVTGAGVTVWVRGSIGAIVRTGVGTYTVALTPQVPVSANVFIQSAGAGLAGRGFATIDAQSTTSLTVGTKDTAGNPTDRDFQLEIHKSF